MAPEALPGGLRISPARSNATAAPTISSSALICGITREMSEGPDHPSHDARDAEQQDEGEDQLERAVLGQWSYPFRFLGWA